MLRKMRRLGRVFESLENRRMLSVTAAVLGGNLTILDSASRHLRRRWWFHGRIGSCHWRQRNHDQWFVVGYPFRVYRRCDDVARARAMSRRRSPI